MNARHYFHEESAVLSKAVLYGITGYKIHADVVKKFHESEASTQIISAPARTSKSYGPGHGEVVHDFFPMLERDTLKPIIPEKSDVILNWLVGTDYTTLKEWDYAWTDLIDNGLITAMGGVIEKANNSPNQGNMIIAANFGRDSRGRLCRSVIQGKSATNERSLQGEEIRTGLMSEAAEHDERIYTKYLKTRCGRIILPTTPKRRAIWIYELIRSGEEDPSLGIESFTFGPDCNPVYDWDRYYRAQMLAESRTGRGLSHEDPEFAEQFLGHWVFEGGKVLPFRWMDMGDGLPSHVVEDPPEGIEWAEWFVATDYGYSDESCAHWWAKLPDGRLHIAEEIYEKGVNTSAFVRRVKEKSEEMGVRPAYYVGDPRRPEVADLMIQYGLPIYPRENRTMKSRAASHAALVEVMSIDPNTNLARFSISRSCTHTIIEWKHLRRKDGWTGDEHSASALVGKDHAYDCGRYGASTVVRERTRSHHSFVTERHRRAKARYERRPRTSGPLLIGPTPGMMR